MVKQGGDVTIASGVITVNDDSHNHIISNVDGLQSALNAKATPAQITSAIQALDYTSPETSGSALEFITTVNQADGVVSATKASIPVASSDSLGLVKSGTDITVDTNGNVSVVNNSHKHTIANVTNLQDTLDAKATPAQISSAVSALKATDPTASGTATQFISTISQSDGVITATKASLPTAGTSLGMVKSGGNVTISNGTITVMDDSHNHIISNVDGLQSALDAKATPANITTAINALDYSGATASGNATSFITQVTQADGVVSATKATIPSANSTTLGLVKGGGDVTISDGVISIVDDSHNHVISNVDGLQAALNAKATPANITTAIEALDFAEPTASGTSTTFIATVSQADGVISATKKSVPTANGTTLGMVKGGGDVTISSGVITVSDNSHKHTAANISDLTTTMNSAITTAIGALDASDPAASGTATQFISSISQQDGVITATKANITAAALGLSGAMRFLGTSATAITDGATTNPITIGTTSTTVASGNVVLYGSKEFVWNGKSWEELGNEGSYKVQQTAVSSPAASGSTTAFIDTISQNAQGVITATKKNVTFPTLSGGSAAGADATVVGGVTVSGHTVTVGKKTLTAGSNVTITGAADKITIAATDTTYGAASQSAAGLMSAADKTKLDGIATGANKYTLPAATSSTLGGVKIGSNISVSSGTISLSKTNVTNALGYTPPQGDGTGASGTWGINISGSSGSCTGNAATATKLATARAINGTNFDGTSAITTANWGTARTLTIGNTGKSVNGSGNVSWSLEEIGLQDGYKRHSTRNFTNGTLIITSIDYSQAEGAPWSLEIKGNSYGSEVPFKFAYQGYIYNNTIISHGGYCIGPAISGLVAFNKDGKLCFWFPRLGYWQGFSVWACEEWNTAARTNQVVSITDVIKPTSITKEVALNNIKTILRSDNYLDSMETLGVLYGGTGATSFITNYVLMGNGSSAIKTEDAHFNYTAGTTSTKGYEELVLGNSTASGTAGNHFGRLALYSSSSAGVYLTAADTTSWSYTNILPAASGTLLNTGNYTSYTVTKTGSGASGTWGINVTGSSGSCTGNAATATNIAWSGVTSKPSYYDAKAIKSISRSGTTFTATHLDGSTSTFTQQDNNTTYSAATSSAAGLMSAADKAKLDGIASGATANTGDITGVTAGNGLTGGGSSGSVTLNVGAGSGITVAADTVSVNTGYTTSGKNYKVAVDSSSGGLYVNVPWTDNNTWKANSSSSEGYVASGSGQANKVWKTDANGTPAWREDANTTYSAASQSAAGLMSAADKTKLDGIAAGANNYTYTLPTASSSTLGGVKIGTGIAISSGVISNSGVRSISTGSANGTISVNTNGTAANVAVKGLGSAAYKDASGTWGISITGSSASCTGNAATASAVAWANITGKPSTFTPATHTHNLVDLGDIIVSTTTPTSVTNGKWYLIKQG